MRSTPSRCALLRDDVIAVRGSDDAFLARRTRAPAPDLRELATVTLACARAARRARAAVRIDGGANRRCSETAMWTTGHARVGGALRVGDAVKRRRGRAVTTFGRGLLHRALPGGPLLVGTKVKGSKSRSWRTSLRS